MDCSPPGSSVHEISQGRILEWVAISFSRGSSRPGDQIHVSCIGRGVLYHWATREVQNSYYKLLYDTRSPACCSVTTQRNGTGGWEGGSLGREYTGSYGWFALLTAETNTTLYPPTKYKKKQKALQNGKKKNSLSSCDHWGRGPRRLTIYPRSHMKFTMDNPGRMLHGSILSPFFFPSEHPTATV